MSVTTNVMQNEFTLDTCVSIKLCENPNFADFLACRIGLRGSIVHLSSQTLNELTRLCYGVEYVTEKIQGMGARVIMGPITNKMKNEADYLESKCQTLHEGDSQILAYARTTRTTLVTCDRGFVCAAESVGTGVINPDLLPCDERTKNVRSKFRRIVRKASRKPSETRHKTRSLILKPSHKIVWSAFN